MVPDAERDRPGSQNAVIAGATSGIGAAIRDRLIELGYSVVGLGRRSSPRGGASYVHEQIDLSDLDRLPQRVKDLANSYPETRVLVLGAGRGEFGALEELSYQQIRSLMELNFTASAYLCRAFLPGMKRLRKGHLVFIGSEAALRGGRAGSVYCASKFALRGFAQALREETAKSGLRVTVVNPGMVQSPFFDRLDFEPGPEEENYLVPEDVAAAVELAISARAGTVVDEIELSPLKRVVRRKRPP